MKRRGPANSAAQRLAGRLTEQVGFALPAGPDAACTATKSLLRQGRSVNARVRPWATASPLHRPWHAAITRPANSGAAVHLRQAAPVSLWRSVPWPSRPARSRHPRARDPAPAAPAPCGARTGFRRSSTATAGEPADHRARPSNELDHRDRPRASSCPPSSISTSTARRRASSRARCSSTPSRTCRSTSISSASAPAPASASTCRCASSTRRSRRASSAAACSTSCATRSR